MYNNFIVIYVFESFSHQRMLVVSHLKLSLLKSPKVSRTLLSILINLNNAVVWMVSTYPLISKSSSSFTNPLGIVLSAPTTILILISLFIFFYFHSAVCRGGKVHYSGGCLFFVKYHQVWLSSQG